MTQTVAGHFGEWLQGRLGPEGPVALITVACPAMRVAIRHQPGGALRLTGTCARALPMPRALTLCQMLGIDPGAAGVVTLDGPLPPGGGAGASTAALVALARCLAPGTSPEDLARACLAAEGASDPLMLARPDGWLWAPRAAQALHPAPPLPPVTVLGGFLGQGEPTNPADVSFPDIAPLWQDWQATRLTPARLGALSSASAQTCTALRGPSDDPTETLAKELGALGHLRAHTGSARGLIFAPGTVPPHGAEALSKAGLTGVLAFDTGGA